MIVTKKFVLINMPKTGTTFVRNTIKEYYAGILFGNLFWKELMLPRHIRFLGGGKLNYELDQNGICTQIPIMDQMKDIISVSRNPLTRVKSFYSYEWWKKEFPVDRVQLLKEFPKFPDLTFDQFLRMHYKYSIRRQLTKEFWNLNIGPQTLQHIIFYSKNSMEYLTKVKDGKEINLNDEKYFFHV